MDTSSKFGIRAPKKMNWDDFNKSVKGDAKQDDLMPVEPTGRSDKIYWLVLAVLGLAVLVIVVSSLP